MNELRAPDPTLMTLGGDVYVEHANPNRAHIPMRHCEEVLYTRCNTVGYLDMHARDAAYIAVPCRDCFPDAPPPGMRSTTHRIGTYCELEPDPNLSWQVPSAEVDR